tara:strand:- start:11 stop:286 length:276 start_codon:yes stop_codon:yes gene_type:complete
VVVLADVRLSIEEYLELLEATRQTVDLTKDVVRDTKKGPQKTKRKTSAYSKKYKSAFSKVKSKYKTKAGKWKKDGFKKAVKAAHKMAGGKK